jgi:hypothetical protein
MDFKKSIKEHIACKERAIDEANRMIGLIKKVPCSGVYLLTFRSEKRSLLEVKEFGRRSETPELEGTLLAEEIKEPINHFNKGYGIQMRFLKDIEPFDPDSAPLIINWGWVSDEFKKRYFKKE